MPIADPDRLIDEPRNAEEAAAVYDQLEGEIGAARSNPSATDAYRKSLTGARSELQNRWGDQLEQGREQLRRRRISESQRTRHGQRQRPAGGKPPASKGASRRPASSSRRRPAARSSARGLVGGRVGRARRFAVRETGIPGAAASASRLALQILGATIGLAVTWKLLRNAEQPGKTNAVELLAGGVDQAVRLLIDPKVDPLAPNAGKKRPAAPVPLSAFGPKGATFDGQAAARARPRIKSPAKTGTLAIPGIGGK